MEAPVEKQLCLPAIFKFVLVGAEGVGKTCFVKQFMTREFNDAYLQTVGK